VTRALRFPIVEPWAADISSVVSNGSLRKRSAFFGLASTVLAKAHLTTGATMVLLEFAMAPHGQGESLSAQVARILDVIDKSGVPYQLTPMGTILEGEWDDVMAVVTACFKALQEDCPRIGMNLKVDYRAGPESRMRSKIDKVEAALGRKLST
jgi:uncharacterized protein (TIGR00106 family)